MEKVYIEETQSFKWLVIIPVMIAIVFGILSFAQIILKKPMGNHPAPNTVLVLIFILSVGGALLFIYQKLVTSITDQGIHVSFGLLTSAQTIPLTNIKSISIRKYDGLKEFSGWGIRFNARETCYTISGAYGIELELINSSEKILIGTQKPEEMQKVIDLYLTNVINKISR